MAPIFTAQLPLFLAHTILNTTNTIASSVTPTATATSLSTAYPKQYLFKNTYSNLSLYNPTTTLCNTRIISVTFLLLLALADTIAFLLLLTALIERSILKSRAKDHARRQQITDRAGREGQEWSEPWEDEGLLAMEPEERERIEVAVMDWGRSRMMV